MSIQIVLWLLADFLDFLRKVDYRVTEERFMDRLNTDVHKACLMIDKECRWGEIKITSILSLLFMCLLLLDHDNNVFGCDSIKIFRIPTHITKEQTENASL